MLFRSGLPEKALPLYSRCYSPADELKLPPNNHSLTNLPANTDLLGASWVPSPAGPRVQGSGKKNEKWPVLGWAASRCSAGRCRAAWQLAGSRSEPVLPMQGRRKDRWALAQRGPLEVVLFHLLRWSWVRACWLHSQPSGGAPTPKPTSPSAGGWLCLLPILLLNLSL